MEDDMSDQTTAAVFNQDASSAGQQVEAIQGDASGTQEQRAAQPQYITLDEAKSMFQEAENKAFQRAQSLMDKADSRISRKVQERLSSIQQMLDTLKAQGIDVPPDKAQALKNDAIEKAYTDTAPDDPQVSEQAPAQEPEQEGGAVDPVTAIAWKMMKEAGVWIDESNPMLDRGSEMAFLNSVDAAIKAKQGTGASTPDANLPQAPRTPTGAGMVGGHVVPDYGAMSLDQLWEAGKDK